MTGLKRALGPVSLSLYGIGVTVGAGIYALTGEVAGLAGSWAPLAFVLAAVLAGLTGLSYTELSTRYPESAGEAAYVLHAFKRPWLSAAAGYGVVITGMVSSAVILRGFAGYASEFTALPSFIIILGLLGILTGVALWGVRQSVWVAGIITLIEIGGLILTVLLVAPEALSDPVPLSPFPGGGALLGATLIAFFAFVGFEDIVNMAEETRTPVKSLPIAIITTLVVSTLLYMAVVGSAVMLLPGDVLAQSGAPLARMLEAAGSRWGHMIGMIALIALVNGVLVQMLMASRVLYGLSRKSLAPAMLGHLNPVRQVPDMATLTASGFIAILVFLAPIEVLAQITSFFTLSVFSLINLALIGLKRSQPVPDHPVYTVPGVIPVMGAAASLFVLAATLFDLVL